MFSTLTGYSDTIEQTYKQELRKFIAESQEDPLDNPIKVMFIHQVELYLKGIIRLGPPALPFIYRTMKNTKINLVIQYGCIDINIFNLLIILPNQSFLYLLNLLA